MKKFRGRLLSAVLIAAVLAAAFWFGGNGPGMRGWSTAPAVTVVPSQAPEDTAAGENDFASVTPSAVPAAAQEEKTAETDGGGAVQPKPAATAQASPDDAKTTGEKPGVQSVPSGAPTGKDAYLTDPVPEGKPEPVEPQDSVITETAYTCRLSVSCATLLDNLSLLDEEKQALVPEDGWILKATDVTFYEGESVFQLLRRALKQNGIHLEFVNTPIYNSAYIEGIHNLYEFDAGELSGWAYKVNGWFPNYGCSRYLLKEDDVVEWVYTCDLGQDIGGYNVLGSEE